MNGDHYQFNAVYRMLDGAPTVVFSFSVVLRRILHPLLAFPLMKLFGFETGGVIFNILLHGASLLALGLAIRRYFDARAAVMACWLLSSYPGYAYWAGLPYSYAMIVPGSIACTIGLLWWNDGPSLVRTLVVACIVGIVGLGYDLLPFFGGALILLALAKRRWLDVPVAVVVLGAWAAFIAIGIPAIFGFEPLNTNTQSYGVVIGAWTHFWEHLDGWGAYLIRLPVLFVKCFLFGGSITFPILLVLLVAHHVRYRVRPILGPVALAILVATFGVFLFLNAAPPYESLWQLRGMWLARLFQPYFVVVLLVVAAASIKLRETPRYKVLVGAVIACSVAGWLAIAGPYIHVYSFYVHIQQNFYQDKSLAKNKSWLRKLGTRPIGFCRDT